MFTLSDLCNNISMSLYEKKKIFSFQLKNKLAFHLILLVIGFIEIYVFI